MANNREDYIIHTHKDSSVATVDEFLNRLISIARGWNAAGLLRYEDSKGELNIDKIFNKYAPSTVTPEIEQNFKDDKEQLLQLDQEEADNSSFRPLTTTLVANTILAIPKIRVNREVLIGEGNQVITKEAEVFLAEKLLELLNDVKNFPVSKSEIKFKGGKNLGVTKEIFPNITVWIWCRALSKPVEGDEELEGTIINITPYISDLNTNVTKTGGSFSFSLPPLVGRCDEDGNWIIQEKSKVQFTVNKIQNYIADGDLHITEDGELKRNSFYFQNIISENDIVWIRFETLNNELSTRLEQDKKFEIDPQDLPGKIYDMIGLADAIPVLTNPSANDVTINVVGRDLVKLIIEDGCYFFPLDQIPGGLFANEIGDRLLQRIDGKIHLLSLLGQRTIDFTLKFIINALSNLGVAPDDLFRGYANVQPTEGGLPLPEPAKDERSKRFILNVESVKERNQLRKQVIETNREAKTKIEANIKLEELDNITPGRINSVFGSLSNFLQAADNEGVLRVQGQNTVNGWNPFTFKSQQIERDTFPAEFDNKFYKNSGEFRDENDNPTTEEGAFFDKEGNRVDPAIAEQEEQKLKTSQDKVDKQKKAIEKSQEKSKAFDFSGTSVVGAPTITGATPAQDLLNKLEKELEELEREQKAKGIEFKSFQFVPFSKKISELKSPGREAINLVLKHDQENKNLSEFKPKFEDKLMNGIWQIIKLVIDDEIRDRIVVDKSLSEEMGSLINFIQRVCQEPLVEFYTDTYKDQFFFIVRTPPWNRDKVGEFKNSPTLIIDIEEEDVVDDSLGFSNNTTYSWYKLEPQGILDDQSISAFIKAVNFPEYADIWGNKPYIQKSNYIPHFPLTGNKEKRPVGFAVKQAIVDLQFIVEINAYLPFTREGTLTINGDRRIKRGTWVRYKSTGELFYVDGVANNFSITGNSIDRTTTLTLVRGIVEKHFESYFNIIDLTIDETIFNQEDTAFFDIIKASTANWKVNKEVFNFFLRRQQFCVDALPLEDEKKKQKTLKKDRRKRQTEGA